MSDTGDIRLQEIPDRIRTFAIIPSDAEAMVGVLRIAEDEGVFVGRSLGSAKQAGSVARFETSEEAITWILRQAGMAAHGAKLGATTKGRKHTPEARAAIKAAHHACQADPEVRAQTLKTLAMARATRWGRATS